MFRQVLVRGVLSLVLLTIAAYVSDYFLLRYRIATNRNPFGTAQVQRYYAVPRKDGKTEFFFDQPVNEPCVHSLFPHAGEPPCWYAVRKKEKRVNL